MATEQSDRIPSDYTVLFTFRVFKRTWIHQKYFTLRPSNSFHDWTDNNPWTEHSFNLDAWLTCGWPVPIPSAEWNQANRTVSVFGDNLLLCSECGDFLPFRDRCDGWSRDPEDSFGDVFETSDGKRIRGGWLCCNWLASASRYDRRAGRVDESKPIAPSDARLLREFADSRLLTPEFTVKPCGGPLCKPKKLGAIRDFEAYQRRKKAQTSPEVSSWIAQKKKPLKPPRTYDNFVYLVHASGHWKIGVSQNVEQRLREIQTGCPYRVEIVKFWKSENATKVEKALHHRFAEHRMEGEWFKLPDSALAYLKGADDLDREFLAETS